MPRPQTTHFTSTQTRARIRQGLRGLTGQGGGVSLAWLAPAVPNPSLDLAGERHTPLTETEITQWNRARFAHGRQMYANAYKISFVLANTVVEPHACRVGSVAHIIILRGSDLRKARLTPIWLGNHETGGQSLWDPSQMDMEMYERNGENWEFQYEYLLQPTAIAQINEMRVRRSQTSSPTEEDEL